MDDTEPKFNEFLSQVDDICSHISVRHDDNGPYVFALGLKETHTLQMRKIDAEYVLELWHGKTSDEEYVASEPSFANIHEAFSAAKEWLEKDTE